MEDEWVVRTNNPAFGKMQKMLGYRNTWKFVRALFGTTFIDPNGRTIERREKGINVKTEELRYLIK